MNTKLKEAEQLYRKGKIKQVLKLTEDLAQIGDTRALELYINSLYDLRKYKQASNYADRLYKLDQFKGLLAQTKIYLKLAQPSKSLELAMQAYGLKKDPNSIYAVGAAEIQNGNYKNGLKYANELLDVDKRNAKAKAYYLLGIINAVEKKYNIAKSYLIKANKLEPSFKVRSTFLTFYFAKNPIFYFLLLLLTSSMIMFAPLSLALVALVLIVLFYGYFLNIYWQARNPAYKVFIVIIVLQFLLFAVFKLNML